MVWSGKINCVVMAGGRGERLGFASKPLIDLCGALLIERVLGGVKDLCSKIVVAYSRYTRGVEDHVCGRKELCGSCMCIETSGDSYVEDLNKALDLSGFPVLVIPSDTPFIDKKILGDFISKALGTGAEIVNLSVVGRGLIGVSVFKSRSGGWINIVYEYSNSLIDIDTPEDLERARCMCGEDTRR